MAIRNCVNGTISILDGTGCPSSYTPTAPFPAFPVFQNGQVCTETLAASSIPFDNTVCNLAGVTDVQAAINVLCQNQGRSSMRAGPLVNGLVGSHIHNSGAPGAADYTINVQASALPFDPNNCNRITSVNVQGAVDELCAYINTLTLHPAATLLGGSNPALTVNLATQQIGLNLATAGSYDNATCTAALGTPVPNNVQGAITALCTAINTITNHPAATRNAASNPALTVDAATQVISLNLAAPGSFDNTACNANPAVNPMPNNVQGAIDRLCALATAGTHPAATVAAGSNPALTINVGTQVANLDITTAGSFDNTTCNAIAGLTVPNNIQGAIDALCAKVCLTLTNNYDANNCYGTFDCATNTLNISPFPSGGQGNFGAPTALPNGGASVPFPNMPTIFDNNPATVATGGTTLVAPRTGTYQVTAGATFNSADPNNQFGVDILRDGAIIIGSNVNRNIDTTATGQVVTVSVNTFLTAGQTISAQAQGLTGGNFRNVTLGMSQSTCNPQT